MTVSANAYTATDGATEKSIPLIYGDDATLREVLFEAEILRPFLQDVSPLLSGAGNTIQLPEETTSWAVSALTEGTATPISELSFSSDDLTIAWYGDAKQWTVEAEVAVFDYVLGNMRENAVKAIGENRDNQIIAELMNTTSSALYPEKAAGGFYTSADIDADGVFQFKQVQRAKAIMRVAKVRMNFVLYHPYQKLALVQDERIINNNNYNNNVLERGEMKTIDNIQLIEHASIQTVTENSVTVYIALGCMAKPAFWASKVEPRFQMGTENLRDRATTFHYFESFGVKLKRDAGIIPIKSVGAAI